MVSKVKNRGLGKGLSALLGESIDLLTKNNNNTLLLDLDEIKPNPSQPRKYFPLDNLEELSESIVAHGIIQPILVTPDGFGKYIIVAGERRWRAAKLANLSKVPVIVKELDLKKKQILEIALIENIQRQELNVIEEAEAYQYLIDKFGYTQEELAESLGKSKKKSRSYIANILRLNSLPAEIKEKVISEKITMGHARALIGRSNALEISQIIEKKRWSVRELENYLRKANNVSSITSLHIKKNTSISDNTQSLDDLKILTRNLSEKFSTKVVIDSTSKEKKIIIFFSDLEKLDNILEKFK